MKTLKEVKYNIKKILPLVALVAMPAMVACEKDDPKPQKTEAELRAERIAELTALEKTKAKELRDAQKPMSKSYWASFTGNDESNVSRATNLYDTAGVHIQYIDRALGAWGEEFYSYYPETEVVYNASKTYRPIFAELDSLQKVR